MNKVLQFKTIVLNVCSFKIKNVMRSRNQSFFSFLFSVLRAGKSRILSGKTKSDKILVISKDFDHFCPTNNSAVFKFQNMIRFQFYGIQTIFSREKLKKCLVDR